MISIVEDFSEFYREASESQNELILYGAGVNGDYLGNVFDRMGYDFSCYWDNNRNLHGMMLNNKPIRHLSAIDTKKTYYIFMTIIDKDKILDAIKCIESAGIQAKLFIINEGIDKLFAEKRSARLLTHKFTLCSNNCLAGILYKAHGCEMFSPTINLIIKPKDYIKFCSEFQKYIGSELFFSRYEWRPATKEHYPVAQLLDIEIHMVHYKSFEDGKAAWDKRKKRIVWQNLFFILTDHHYLLSREDIEDFLNIEHKNKLCICSKSFYSKINHDDYIFLTEEKILSDQMRIFEDYFDYTSWINAGIYNGE